MNRILSVCLAGGLLLSPGPGLVAGLNVPVAAQTPSVESFWYNSVDLLQRQLDLLDDVEQSLYSTQRSDAQHSYRKLFNYIGQLDRYLGQYGVFSRQTCTDQPLTGDQLAVYCALFDSRNTIFELRAIAEQRQARLSTGEESLLFMGGGDPFLSADTTPQEVWQSDQETLAIADPHATKPAQNQGEIQRPAIAPLPQTTATINAQRNTLLALQNQLPEGLSIEHKNIYATTTTRYSYVPTAQERELYQDFLAQPHTGLSRLMPRAAYEETHTVSSLKPSLLEQFPFPSLGETKPLPNLPLLFTGNTLGFVPEGLNIGLIADLGEVADGDLPRLVADHPLTRYRSPTTFIGLQQEQRLVLFQKDPTVETFSTAPLELHHTYLIRLVQYDFAPEILGGIPLPRHRLAERALLAKPTGYDLLVSATPVRTWLDGSYTLLWQVIEQQTAPTLTDLIDYIEVMP